MTVRAGAGGTTLAIGLSSDTDQQFAASAILPGVFNTIANLSQLFASRATLPGVFNVSANLTFAYDLVGAETESIPPWASYYPQTDLYAGGYATQPTTMAWQGTAVLATIASLLANPSVQGFSTATLSGVFNVAVSGQISKLATAVLPGAFNVIANLNKAGLVSATLPGVFNVAATLIDPNAGSMRFVQITDSRPFVWYGDGTLINQGFPDSGPPVWLASAVFAGTFSLLADSVQSGANVWQGTAVLSGVFSLAVNAKQTLAALATLPGAFNVVAAANAAGFAFATLPGVFTLSAAARAQGFAFATLPGTFNLSASSVTNWPATTVLPGVFNLAANVTNTKVATAVLPGVFNLATSGTIAKLATTTLAGVFNVLADTKQRGFVFATLPGIFNVTASATATGQIAATLSGVFSYLAGGDSILPFRTVQITDSVIFPWYNQRSFAFAGALESPPVTWQATARLAGFFSLSVNTSASATLAGVFNLAANLSKQSQISAILVGRLSSPAGNFNIAADTIQSAPAAFRTVQVTDSAVSRWYDQRSFAFPGALETPTTVWQATARLAGIFSLSIGSFSQATLPASFSLIAAPFRASQISSRLASIFNLSALLIAPADVNFRTVQVTDSRVTRWYQDYSGQRPGLLGTTQVTEWQATSVFASAFNFNAATFFAWQATALLAAVFNTTANLYPNDPQRTVQVTDSRVFGYYRDLSNQRPGLLAPFIPALSQISATLAAVFNLPIAPGLNFLASATLRGSFALIANPILGDKLATARLAGIFSLASNATNTKQVSARLTGVFSLSGAFRTAWQANAQLAGVFNWLVNERFFSPRISATLAAEFGLAASMFQFDAGNGVRPGGGSSRYIGNQYGYVGPLLDPKPGKPLKKRKQVTEAKLPPEASIPPDPAPLPDISPTPFVIRRPPAKTYSSGIEDHADEIARQIRAAHSSIDERDAMDALHGLLQQDTTPPRPPEAPAAPMPAMAPPPPVSPTPVSAHNAMDEHDAMAILQHLKLV